MSYAFTVIGSRVRLLKQRQDATLLRLNEALTLHPLMQRQTDLFLYEHQKHKGNAPLSFIDMLELWGWYPTFDQTTSDLVGLTSDRAETEDEQIERLFLDALAPDLDDENYVEVDIDHQRRRYVSFQSKIYRLDASYSYPSLHKVIAQVIFASRAKLELPGRIPHLRNEPNLVRFFCTLYGRLQEIGRVEVAVERRSDSQSV